LEVVENDPAHATSGPAIGDLLARSETTRLLADAIAQLPQIHREIVELVAFQERSYDEAAAIIGDGVTANTLRSRMFHALRRLRTLLQASGGDQGNDLI
jgi:RNA polymerase sigma-70 factor (ECF subfamily)